MKNESSFLLPNFDKEKISLSCMLLTKDSGISTKKKVVRVVKSEFHKTDIYVIQGSFKPISKLPL